MPADWIDSYMVLTDNSEPPAMFRRWVAISTLAAVLQRKCYLPWGTLTFYPNLYVVLIGPPGKARKGTAMAPGLDFLNEPGLNIKLAAEAITREALIRELKNAADTYINSETGEMIFHSSLTVYSPELTVFLGYQNTQLLSDLTDWYDCRKKWTYRTKWSGVDTIDGVWVNILGATTPALIQSSMPLDAIGGGLTSRMIFIYEPRRGKVVPDPFPTQEELDLLKYLQHKLELISMMGGPFRVTDEFMRLWTEWYLEQEHSRPFEDERFAAYIERRPANIMKLSMITCASRTLDMVITEDDLKRAIIFLEEAEIKMPMALSGVGRYGFAGILSSIMVEISTRKECELADLLRIFRHDITSWDLNKMLDTLEAMHFCHIITNTGKILYNESFDEQ